MDSCFCGRSSGIGCLIEPFQYTKRTENIKKFIEELNLFEFDVSALEKDVFFEIVYVSSSVLEK